LPTRRGWLLVGASVVLAVIGRLLGLVELYVLATAAAVLVMAAVVWVRLGRCEMVGARTLHPPRAHAGQSCRVELTVRNLARRHSPLMLARDPFDGGRRSARFLLAPLEPAEVARAAYRLPSERRGVFTLGPLALERRDPFGLATSATTAAGPTRFTVYPHVDPITCPAPARGGHQSGTGDPRSFLGQRGEDFYTLRSYDEGDDLRRVHWPATARAGDLLIRQEEALWQGGVTVAVDLRRTVQSSSSLEVALSAAASVVTAATVARTPVRLVTSAGIDSGTRSGSAHLDTMLTRLAEATVTQSGDLASTVALLADQRAGGSLVLITTTAASELDLGKVAQLRRWFGPVILVLLQADGASGAVPREPTVPGDLTTVRVSTKIPLAVAWAQMLSRQAHLGPRPVRTHGSAPAPL